MNKKIVIFSFVAIAFCLLVFFNVVIPNLESSSAPKEYSIYEEVDLLNVGIAEITVVDSNKVSLKLVALPQPDSKITMFNKNVDTDVSIVEVKIGDELKKDTAGITSSLDEDGRAITYETGAFNIEPGIHLVEIKALNTHYRIELKFPSSEK